MVHVLKKITLEIPVPETLHSLTRLPGYATAFRHHIHPLCIVISVAVNVTSVRVVTSSRRRRRHYQPDLFPKCPFFPI